MRRGSTGKHKMSGMLPGPAYSRAVTPVVSTPMPSNTIRDLKLMSRSPTKQFEPTDACPVQSHKAMAGAGCGGSTLKGSDD